jgi:hypothetical protein
VYNIITGTAQIPVLDDELDSRKVSAASSKRQVIHAVTALSKLLGQRPNSCCR